MLEKFRFAGISAILAAGIAFVAPANAQDASQYSWEGFYVGANVGGRFADDDLAASTRYCGGPGIVLNGNYFISTNGCYFAQSSADLVSSSGNQTVNPAGFTGGLQAGYNFQAGNFVAGVEADFNLDRRSEAVSGTDFYTNVSPAFPFEVGQSIDTDWMATVRARAGFTTGRTLIYATGGLALTHVDYQMNFEDFPPPVPPGFVNSKATASSSIQKTLAGWAVGAGAEFKIDDRWSLAGSYLFTQFDASGTSNDALMTTINSSGGVNGTPQPLQNQIFDNDITLRSHSFRIGINYKL
jgi:outer membrane immunogenic protein